MNRAELQCKFQEERKPLRGCAYVNRTLASLFNSKTPTRGQRISTPNKEARLFHRHPDTLIALVVVQPTDNSISKE